MGLKLTPFRGCQARRPNGLPLALVAFGTAAGVIGCKWTTGPGGLAVFWLNNGLVAAALLLLTPARGLAVAGASVVVDVLCTRYLGRTPWGQTAAISAFDLAEAWLAASLIRGCGGAALNLTDVRRFAAVILRGVLPATVAVGTTGAVLFHLLYGLDLRQLWLSWAGGDFLAMSIAAPAALIIGRFERFDRPRRISARASLLWLSALCALSIVPFFAMRPLVFIIFPLFLVAAFRLTPPYVSAGLAIVAVSTVTLSIAGFGPITAARLGEDFVLIGLQLFVACVVFTVFLAQASLAERARSQSRAQNALRRISRARAMAEQALAELATSEARFRLLADNASDVISRCDARGRLTYISPSAREMYGYTPEELIGGAGALLVHPEDLPPFRAQWRELIARGPGALGPPQEFRVVTRGGETRWIEASTRVTRHPETGETLELHGIARDITHRKALEAELEARRLEAEAASVAKGQFLANMSHEIRTPLNGVIAMADMLARSDLAERDRKLVEIIRSSGDSLNRLLCDILDLARVESGKVELEATPFHFGQAVRSAVALCALQAQEKGVALEVEVAATADRHFEGDEVRIRQIVTNLVSNAVKFTAEGAVRVRVWTPDAGGVGVEVSDTGVGFDPALKARLFDRFQQADGSITRRFGGTGLGLPISRHLAEAMGGHLDCDSVPGEGSRFWFEAPLPPVEGAEASLAPEPVQRSGGGRVLVVDDHPTNRTVAELILTDFGFEVEAAEDGQEALNALEARTYDLVLMDMQMPVMDGLTAVRRWRAVEAERGLARTPVLMLSANALAEHVVQSEAAGADGHVAKPITAAALLAAVAALAEADKDVEEPLRARV
jgi:PAS domain S-box-containing protein